MANPEDIEEVNNMLNLLTTKEEIEKHKEAEKNPYRWVMKTFTSPKFPSLCSDSVDIEYESALDVADETWKSHIYNIRCAIHAMEPKQSFIVWIDYCFHRLKAHESTTKVQVDKYEPGEEKQLKTRKYHYWINQGYNLALSPAVQSFRFKGDDFLKRHGLEVKYANLPFVHLNRKVRFVETNKSFFMEEPWKTLELEYFRNPTMMLDEDVQKRKREEREAHLPEAWGNATKK